MMFEKNKHPEEKVTSGKETFKNQRSSEGYDIQKKILVLENSVEKLSKDMGETTGIKDIKELLAKVAEIKDKLREMEDLGLITKLETIQMEDEMQNLTDDIGTLKAKVDLLSGAIKLISTKIAEISNLAGQDKKKGAKEIDMAAAALKSEVDSLKKRLDSHGTKEDALRITELEHKYRSMDTDFKKFIADVRAKIDEKDKELKRLSSGKSESETIGNVNKADIDALKKEVTSVKSAVLKVEKVLETSRQTAKELESRINENNERMLVQLKEQQKSKDQESEHPASQEIEQIKGDIQGFRETTIEERDKILKNIAICRNETAELAKKLNSLDELKRKVDELPKVDETYRQRLDSLDNQVKSLGQLRNRAEHVENQLSVIEKKIAESKMPKKEILGKLSIQDANGNYLKYVPVLKENISKLYNVYNRTEKRINDIESNINEIKELKSGKGSIPNEMGEAAKKAVEIELKEVVENINTLSSDIKSQIAGEIRKQNVLMNALKKDYESRIQILESEIADAQKKKVNAKSNNYEEFAEFKARMLSEIDELRRDMKCFEEKICSGEVENIVENKLIPHVSNQDNIAKSIALLNRKVEQKHMEVSKNTHEKINTSVKSIMERVSQIENDIDLLKDMRVDLVDDITTILDHSGKEKAGLSISAKKLEEKYDRQFKELREMIERVRSEKSTVPGSGALAEEIRSIQYENEVLKKELEKIKSLYFEMLQRKEDMPVIIE